MISRVEGFVPEFRIIQVILGNSEMVAVEHLGLNLLLLHFALLDLADGKAKRGLNCQ